MVRRERVLGNEHRVVLEVSPIRMRGDHHPAEFEPGKDEELLSALVGVDHDAPGGRPPRGDDFFAAIGGEGVEPGDISFGREQGEGAGADAGSEFARRPGTDV